MSAPVWLLRLRDDDGAGLSTSFYLIVVEFELWLYKFTLFGNIIQSATCVGPSAPVPAFGAEPVGGKIRLHARE